MDQLATAGSADRPFGPSVSSSLTTLATLAAAAGPYREVAEGFGIDLQMPFLDNVVVDESLGWDECQRPPNAVTKPMLDGLHRRFGVPPADRVVAKGQRGHERDFAVGIRTNLASIKGLFRESRLAERDVIDLDRWFTALDLAAAGAGCSPAAIARTTAAEIWMQRNCLS
ncbi:hypothetical protein [Desertimonas flava]|uniref:hypothetical protein n=1 Tax=Desertimonas flava TaxID=2064846 RepID=UPI0013C50948|nr:hypothetical protein [Desertimonas flava]